MPSPPTPITPELLARALTYPQYGELAQRLYVQGRTTADDPHFNTPEMLAYTRLNLQRVQRLDQVPPLAEAVVAAARAGQTPLTWVVLAESWCGDVAQNLPVINRIAEASEGRILLRILLRDANLPVMDAFLTNGGRAIPKLVCLRTVDLALLGTWGPRPAPIQAQMTEWRLAGMPYAERNERLHTWYARDKTATLQAEFAALLAEWG